MATSFERACCCDTPLYHPLSSDSFAARAAATAVIHCRCRHAPLPLYENRYATLEGFGLRDIAKGVRSEFGVDITEGLEELDGHVQSSKDAYANAVRAVKGDNAKAFEKLVALEPVDAGDALEQDGDDLDQLLQDAEEAQHILRKAVASEWEEDDKNPSLKRPVRGTTKPWVDGAKDPGTKSRERAREKLDKECGGNVRKLKDLARMSLIFRSCEGLLDGLEHLRSISGWEVRKLKNKFASPTPLGCVCFFVCILRAFPARWAVQKMEKMFHPPVCV